MKYLKILLAIVAALVLAVMVYAMTLPGDISISRTIKINVPQSYAFDYLYDIKNWEEWTTWKEFDSTLVYSYPGKTEGEGAKQKWNGDHSEAAALTFESISVPEKINFMLVWNKGETSFSGYIKTKSVDETHTTVEWVHYKSVGWNPFMRLLGSMLDNVMGPNFDKGLSNLKKKLELKYNVETKNINVVSN
ncbi:MAG: hypothetical protein CVV25_04085 [Ignavibacteriae bacterium HGW-Ignavibacteriae-4]|jgi:hypothetical protein|nr:MAG: hypothetical protein CVV25_04085 [Ignavibacteriae bacterium HGW-Ignavibacteriae-4]